ncbi:MAG: hypothetical protein ACKN9U_14530, partial [Pirellulaceae bacterium]
MATPVSTTPECVKNQIFGFAASPLLGQTVSCQEIWLKSKIALDDLPSPDHDFPHPCGCTDAK